MMFHRARHALRGGVNPSEMETEIIAQQRAQGMTLAQIAQLHGYSKGHIRRVCGECRMTYPAKERATMVAKLWGRGTVSEIAEFLGVAPKVVRRIAVSNHMREGTRQLVLWVWAFRPARKRRCRVRSICKADLFTQHRMAA